MSTQTKKRSHLKTADARVFIHTGKTSKRLHLGFIMTEAQERSMGRFADDLGEHVEGGGRWSSAPVIGEGDAITGAGLNFGRFDPEKSDVA